MKTLPTWALFISLGWIDLAEAQYVLILNNGRQITVQSYREETGMIKFQSYGGEIGISKDQVKAIRRSSESASGGLALPSTPPAPGQIPEPTSIRSSSDERPEPALTPDEERAKEEKEYEQKLLDVNERLKAARDNYSQTIRGTTSLDPTLLTTEEQMKARQDDIISRALDAQYRPSDPAGTRLLTPSPFTTLAPSTVYTQPPPEATPRFGTALPQYTPRQKELSEMRSQTLELEREKDKLIEEMNKKNFLSGKLLE